MVSLVGPEAGAADSGGVNSPEYLARVRRAKEETRERVFLARLKSCPPGSQPRANAADSRKARFCATKGETAPVVRRAQQAAPLRQKQNPTLRQRRSGWGTRRDGNGVTAGAVISAPTTRAKPHPSQEALRMGHPAGRHRGRRGQGKPCPYENVVSLREGIGEHFGRLKGGAGDEDGSDAGLGAGHGGRKVVDDSVRNFGL
jgi:hypothetical protein